MLTMIAERLKQGRKVILLHGNADPDALGCGYAIAKAFPDADICAPGGLDKISKVIAMKLNLKVLDRMDMTEYDQVVVVDTSSPDQLGEFSSVPANAIIIDHHARSDRWGDRTYYCDDKKKSCAEIVYQLLRVAGIGIERDVGLALLAGMLTDSGHFRYSNAGLLRSFADLMEEAGLEIDEVTSVTDLEPDVSERISQLKGAQRIRFDRVGDRIVAISVGSAYESSVCKGMLAIGADVAFVGSQRDQSFRLSARARPEMVRMGFHLGKVLENIGVETSNDGGGHGGAAGLVGVGDVEAILNICMQRAMDFLREKKRSRESLSP
ncbi:MAG TPA: DHH family phosphoesterase [Methanomassiliicoccales archaeon]|jgi:nanoRNase/pAp phosphatase (c-di-AMP/oligoRNAs hydrolase)